MIVLDKTLLSMEKSVGVFFLIKDDLGSVANFNKNKATFICGQGYPTKKIINCIYFLWKVISVQK